MPAFILRFPTRQMVLRTALAAVVCAVAGLFAWPLAARASVSEPLIQQGAKLVGTGAVGNSQQGYSVALSADGNTALVGGYLDSGLAGAAWVFTRSGGKWTQQASKLLGSGAAGPAEQGFSVALSADGNTALIGAPGDNGGAGAAWVFTRSGANWTQQGAKLVGTGAGGNAGQGNGVALAADGNTAVIGGPADNGAAGAVWVFTRSGGNWSQQGGKLVGGGAVGPAGQGYQVALSADGNTTLAGGRTDNNYAGAAWIFTRSAGTWTQQGGKLVGTGGSASALQGGSVALSGDGNTALIGGPADNSFTGAVWAFARTGGVWTQQGPKIVAAEAHPTSYEGTAAALSSDGNTALIGGNAGESAGGAWLFRRAGNTWSQRGAKLVGADASGNAQQGTSVALSGDAITALVGGPEDNLFGGAAWVFGAPAISGPQRLTFGSQIVGQAGPVLWLPVVDSGQAPLSFTGPASIAGPAALDFTIPAGDDLCNGTSLQPDQLCWVGVQFTPASSGARGATLTLGASSAGLPRTIAISGTGVAANSGPAGTPGPQGVPGPRGPAGQIELVTCRVVTGTVNRHGKRIHVTRQLCTAKLLGGPVTFTTTGALSASLDRGRTVYAVGIARRTRRDTQLLLTPRRPVRPGRYSLRVLHRGAVTVIVR